MNWNFNLQRQLNEHLFAAIGYVGSHTVHQSFAAGDHNQVAPPQVQKRQWSSGVAASAGHWRIRW